MVLQIFLFLIAFGFGLVNIFYPEFILRVSDRLRITGERKYTSFAIASTRISGGFFILLAVVGLAITVKVNTDPYTVRFSVPNESYTFYDPVEVEKGETINLNNYTPTREGYRFLGWTEQSEIDILFNPERAVLVSYIYQPDDDVLLTAVFIEIEE